MGTAPTGSAYNNLPMPATSGMPVGPGGLDLGSLASAAGLEVDRRVQGAQQYLADSLLSMLNEDKGKFASMLAGDTREQAFGTQQGDADRAASRSAAGASAGASARAREIQAQENAKNRQQEILMRILGMSGPEAPMSLEDELRIRGDAEYSLAQRLAGLEEPEVQFGDDEVHGARGFALKDALGVPLRAVDKDYAEDIAKTRAAMRELNVGGGGSRGHELRDDPAAARRYAQGLLADDNKGNDERARGMLEFADMLSKQRTQKAGIPREAYFTKDQLETVRDKVKKYRDTQDEWSLGDDLLDLFDGDTKRASLALAAVGHGGYSAATGG